MQNVTLDLVQRAFGAHLSIFAENSIGSNGTYILVHVLTIVAYVLYLDHLLFDKYCKLSSPYQYFLSKKKDGETHQCRKGAQYIETAFLSFFCRTQDSICRRDTDPHHDAHLNMN